MVSQLLKISKSTSSVQRSLILCTPLTLVLIKSLRIPCLRNLVAFHVTQHGILWICQARLSISILVSHCCRQYPDRLYLYSAAISPPLIHSRTVCLSYNSCSVLTLVLSLKRVSAITLLTTSPLCCHLTPNLEYSPQALYTSDLLEYGVCALQGTVSFSPWHSSCT